MDLLELSGIEINPDGVQRDQVLKFNGTNFVPATPDATFEFTIADFDMNITTTPQLIGTDHGKMLVKLLLLRLIIITLLMGLREVQKVHQNQRFCRWIGK